MLRCCINFNDSLRKKSRVFDGCKVLLFFPLLVKYKSPSRAFPLNEAIGTERKFFYKDVEMSIVLKLLKWNTVEAWMSIKIRIFVSLFKLLFLYDIIIYDISL